MKDPCEECIVGPCCRQECEAKVNYIRFLKHEEDVFLNYFRHNVGKIPEPISQKYNILRKKLGLARYYEKKIINRQLGIK